MCDRTRKSSRIPICQLPPRCPLFMTPETLRRYIIYATSRKTKFTGDKKKPPNISIDQLLPQIPKNRIPVKEFIPAIDLHEGSPEKILNSCQLCCQRKVIIVGLPGAFTPDCTKFNLPNFIRKAKRIKSEHGVDEIACISVNDAYVMSAWGKKCGAAGKVRMLADPNGRFSAALGLISDWPCLGGLRSKRFSMLVNNCIVEVLEVLPDDTGKPCSLTTDFEKCKCN